MDIHPKIQSKKSKVQFCSGIQAEGVEERSLINNKTSALGRFLRLGRKARDNGVVTAGERRV